MAETPLPPHKHRRLFVVGLAICMVFLALAFVCVFIVARFIFPSRDLQADTLRLQAVLPLLAQHKVEDYFNKDWCKGIKYGRGMFSEPKHRDSAENCSLFSGGGATKPFDIQARQDFELLGKALEGTNINIYEIEDVTFDASGAVVYVVFHQDCGFCRTRYVYRPNYSRLPEEIPGELWHTKINDNWYLEEEDWN